jgi:hypothetical protein
VQIHDVLCDERGARWSSGVRVMDADLCIARMREGGRSANQEHLHPTAERSAVSSAGS